MVQSGQDGRRFVHLTWVCNRLDNVRTAWSLGSRDQAVTILQFLAENRRLPPLFQAAHLVLAGEDDAVNLQERIDETELAVREFNLGVLSDPGVNPEALSGAEVRLREPKPPPSRNFSARGWAAAPETALAGEDTGDDTPADPPPDQPDKKKKKNVTRKRRATR